MQCGDVIAAWIMWSSAAEGALADAFRLAGGPSRPVAWLVGVVLLGSILSGWVGPGFVRICVTCLIQ